mgnify:CR=1 FL=1
MKLQLPNRLFSIHSDANIFTEKNIKTARITSDCSDIFLIHLLRRNNGYFNLFLIFTEIKGISILYQNMDFIQDIF